MATNYGQPPHFDISKPLFAPLVRIEYGSSTGTKRSKLAIRRYTYQYINDSFVFFKTFAGVRQRGPDNRITSVNDTSNINIRNGHAVEKVSETSPTFITQTLLNSLFDHPSKIGLFFIEGRIYKQYIPDNGGKPEFTFTAPEWFDIYRYGKIINNQIVVLKESEGVITRKDY